MDELYKNIRERRKELKMSQDELARKVGYTNRSSIATVEAGKIRLSYDKINAIAKALETTTPYLMGMTNDPNPIDVSDELGAIMNDFQNSISEMIITTEYNESITVNKAVSPKEDKLIDKYRISESNIKSAIDSLLGI